MSRIDKFKGIIPAFYACYDSNGEVSIEQNKKLARYLADKGVQGLYVGGSSGECIYHSVEERKKALKAVMEEVGGQLTVIAHVACNNTRDSAELAAYAEHLGVDAIASIPPIYFHLPEYAIADYWNTISGAACNTPFIIYNIPQLAGVALSHSLLREMLKNPNVIGVKNSSVSVQDIRDFKDIGGEDFIVFNGPDEQLAAGLMMGAEAGIGGTYAVMPELFLAVRRFLQANQVEKAQQLQGDIVRIIEAMLGGRANLYAVMKEYLKRYKGLDLGGVRAPLTGLCPQDDRIVTQTASMIEAAVKINKAAKLPQNNHRLSRWFFIGIKIPPGIAPQRLDENDLLVNRQVMIYFTLYYRIYRQRSVLCSVIITLNSNDTDN